MIYYTDGSCDKNGFYPNKGGYGIVEFDLNDNLVNSWAVQHENTTNNREEMLAILWVMENRGHYVFDSWGFVPRVYTDSEYALNVFTKWMFNWEQNNWTKPDGKTPENLDIIKQYYNKYKQGYRIDLVKIKGHNGHLGNELADKLANGSMTPKEVSEKFYGDV